MPTPRPLLLPLILFVAANCEGKGDRAAPPNTPEAKLVAEFREAYPPDVQPIGVVRSYDLRAAPASLELIDGRPLQVWAYNGQVPGPTLRVKLGETIRVRFTNDLPSPTTIHWHGIRLPNAMDGVPGVTQPPIRPGETFVYEFTPKDAGTFWFHPHLDGSEQLERGLHGLLIVEDAEPPPYSRDEIWVLDDWRLTDDGKLDERFNTRHDLAHDGRWGSTITVNGSTGTELQVAAGERIRLRLVNVANGRMFAPDFGELKPEVVAFDGLYTARPLPADELELAPGNRIDLDLQVPANAAGKRFVITDRFTRRILPLAEIVVSDAVGAPPSFPSPARGHVPKWAGGVDTTVVETFRLNARQGGPFGIEWTINDQVMRHGTHEQDGGAHEHEVRRLPVGEWAHLRFVNESGRLHPMHIHGQFFKVLARNNVPVDEEHFRDTVLIRGRETVDIGMVPLDEGAWMLHCHIQEHAESGMMTTVEVSRHP